MALLGMTREELRSAIAELIALLASGYTDKEIREEMGVSAESFEKLKNAMYAQEGEKIRSRPTEQTYIDYCHAQLSCVEDLNDILEHFKSSRQHSAMVGAIRARSDIYDKIIDRGQEFGFIEKKAEEKRITAGVMVAKLTDGELRKLITGELASLDRMMHRYGEGSIFDLKEAPTHYALPEPAVVKKTPKKVRARTSRVSKGRRVVKEPIL